MTRLSLADLYSLLHSLHPGREGESVIVAGAIMSAESGGDEQAISPSGDYGIFQINRIHFGDGIITATNWQSVPVQIAEMWHLSAGMTNYAAWCTMWANPGRDCGHGFINYPQPGSSVAGHYQVAYQAYRDWFEGHPTSGPPGSAPAPGPSGRVSLTLAMANIRSYTHHGGPRQYADLRAHARAIRRV